MINYFDAAENTLRGRGFLDSALKNLECRKERIVQHGSPAGYPSPDFHIAELVVREEADVKKISRELYNMQKAKSRGKGVV